MKLWIDKLKSVQNSGSLWHALGNETGNFLIGLMAVVGLISILSVSAVTFLMKEKIEISRDFARLTAASVARSCLALAQPEIIPIAKLSNIKKKFKFGSRHFPTTRGFKTRCTVNVQIRSRKIYLRSTATVEKENSKRGSPSHIMVQKTVKTLYHLRSNQTTISLWQVSQ